MLDLISRKDAISILQKEINKFIPPLNNTDWWMRYGIHLSKTIIEDLPAIDSVPSAQKTGKWIEKNIVLTTDPPQHVWYCSECGIVKSWYTDEVLTNYCPNCGARMEGKDG